MKIAQFVTFPSLVCSFSLVAYLLSRVPFSFVKKGREIPFPPVFGGEVFEVSLTERDWWKGCEAGQSLSDELARQISYVHAWTGFSHLLFVCESVCCTADVLPLPSPLCVCVCVCVRGSVKCDRSLYTMFVSL